MLKMNNLDLKVLYTVHVSPSPTVTEIYVPVIGGNITYIEM